LNDEALIQRVTGKKDLTFFFTYSLKDKIDENSEYVCDQLSGQLIDVTIITKGDLKMANIITYKYLKCQEDKVNTDNNVLEEKMKSVTSYTRN